MVEAGSAPTGGMNPLLPQPAVDNAVAVASGEGGQPPSNKRQWVDDEGDRDDGANTQHVQGLVSGTPPPRGSASSSPARTVSPRSAKQRAVDAIAIAAMQEGFSGESDGEYEERIAGGQSGSAGDAGTGPSASNSGAINEGVAPTTAQAPSPPPPPQSRQLVRPPPVLHLLRQFERHELRDRKQWNEHLWRARRGGFQGVRAPLMPEFAATVGEDGGFRSLLQG
jgi:hypothetical protein